jgi:hypothetical protein
MTVAGESALAVASAEIPAGNDIAELGRRWLLGGTVSGMS